MRTDVALALACSALAALPAAAQTVPATEDASASRGVVFEGAAAPMCVVQALTASNAQNTNLVSPQSGGATIALSAGAFIDPQTGVARTSGIELALPVTCNSPHHLRVASGRGALMLEGGSTSGTRFRDRLDFRVEVDWAGRQQAFETTSASALEIPVGGAATGDVAIRIRIPGGGAPLVAGSYTDYLTIVVETDS